MKFNSCKRPTVGVEWELQLLNSHSLDLYDGIVPLMTLFPDTDFVKPEYIQPCVELNSCIAANSEQAIRHIGQTLNQIQRGCTKLDINVCGSGTHPFSKKLALITPLSRYKEIEKKSGYLAHAQITFSAHVHIGMASGDEAIRVMSYLMAALPVFIALSANSPFWRDHKTGHAAYRHRILAASPSYGMPVRFSDWADFNNFYSAAKRSGTINTIKDIHWDIRPHPDFGTIEIRTMDSPSNINALHALVSFCRVVVVSMARSSSEDIGKIFPLELPFWILKENCYRASHLGLDAEYIYNNKGQHRPLRILIEKLFDFCNPIALDIEEAQYFDFARNYLLGETSYQHQLNIFNQTQSTIDVTKDLVNQLLIHNRTI